MPDERKSIIVFVFDADPSIPELIEMLEAKYGAVTATRFEFTPPVVVVPPPNHNFAPRTNQAVINLFAKVFDGPYIEVITRAGLSGIFSARQAVYSGPDVERLTLGEEEKKRIIEAL